MSQANKREHDGRMDVMIGSMYRVDYPESVR